MPEQDFLTSDAASDADRTGGGESALETPGVNLRSEAASLWSPSSSDVPRPVIPFASDRAPKRATVYWILLVVLVGGSFLLRGTPWQGDAQRHTILEFVGTTLAFVAGGLALVRFYSRKQETFLFIGTGFLATGVLDAYHAIITSNLAPGLLIFGNEGDAAAWTWIASRSFLSIFLFASLLLWKPEGSEERTGVNETSVYMTAVMLTAVTFLFFAFVPISTAYFPESLAARPGEFVPAFFFFLAMAGYLRKGQWRRESFEHWLIIALLISVMLHGAFMAHATEEFDSFSEAAHLLKIASYVAVLGGLMINVFVTFQREGQAFQAIHAWNETMTREVEVRRAAEHRLQDFLDNANDLIQVTDPQGNLVYANRAWQRTLGHGEDELAGLNIRDLVAEGDRGRLMEAFKEVQAGTPLVGLILEFTHRNGHPVICSVNANPSFQDGEFIAVRSIMRDVTKQTNAEAELAASRANLNALVENTGDAIWSVGTDHRLITFNSAFALEIEARSGFEPSVGDAPEDSLPRDQVAWYREAYDLALMGNRLSRAREEVVNEQLRHYELFFNPIRDERGTAGVAVFSKDVTWRKQAENQLLAAKVEAEEANVAKSQFLANMSHELRTPLNSVIGFANVLLKNKSGNLVEQELGFLERIKVNGRHLLTLINEILDLAKIESGKLELETHLVDLGAVARDAMSLVDDQIRQKEGMVEVRADVPKGLAEIEGDSAKLKQVLVNLVGNALKFTEKGEIVIQIRTTVGSDAPAVIAVRDTGIGIPPERLEVIFQAFQQAEAGTARTFGGTGLGLTISRELCKLMGYDLTVDSVVGEGTTFTIHLHPGEAVDLGEDDALVTDKAGEGMPGYQAPAVAPLVPAQQGKPYHVLVIDDDADSRALLTHYLEGFGCRVSQAVSAAEGISKARKEPPDLLTLDLVMPDLDGWDTMQILRQDPNLSDIPVVVISVVAGEARSRLLGAVDLLNKPVEREDLLRVLWRNLGSKSSRRVLVVDDDLDFQRLVGEYLAGDGVKLQFASNGEEALQMIEKESPDAVFLELAMPVMDGMEFLEKLRAIPYHTGLPVIVVTAKDPNPDERRILNEQASGILIKDEELEDRLRDVMSALFPAKAEPEEDQPD